MARYNRRYQNFRPTCSDDAVVSGIDEYVAYLAAFLERGNMEMFLKRLAELSAKLRSEPLWGRALFVPELDELVRRASLIITPKPNPSANSKLLVHIATEVYPTGGHTRVMEDIVTNLPEHQHVLILTRMYEAHPGLVSLKPRFDELSFDVRLLRSSGWTRRARELSSLITELSPDAILLFAHQEDSIANAGVAGHSAPRILFLHHADHQPSLGAFRADYMHVDLTPACHKICASHPRLHTSMLNLTAKGTGTVKLVERHPIIGATCGAPYKYAGSTEFTYGQLLAALFSAGVGRILHIGDMPDEQKNQIRTEITVNGQDASRMTFLPNTPSLTAKLLEVAPDFYLVSHPIGSGKATLEATSVGLPIVQTRPASGLPLLFVDMTFDTSVVIQSLDQVPAAVLRLKGEKSTLANCSRSVYEKHYSPAAFREGLLSAIGIDH
ncbi:MAG: hypothetical protein WBD87_13750 [Candidatus Acidiferrales bacterium]